MIEEILSRLDKVRRTGPNNWLACCPAHEDRSPSFTLRAEDDGRILAKCHAECDFGAIVEAVGMGWNPWFPPKPLQADRTPAVRRPFPAADVLEAVAFETTLVCVTALNVANGVPLTDEDRERLLVAHDRVQNARRMALGER